MCVSVTVYTAKSFAVIKITQLVVIYDVSVIKFYGVSLNHISAHKVDPFRACNASEGLEGVLLMSLSHQIVPASVRRVCYSELVICD